MRQQRNYYEILGVARTASPQEIKERYLELARKYHPDRASDKELAQRIFMQVNKSYTTLSDPEKRTLYDVRLIESRTASSAPAFSYSAGGASPPPPSQDPPPVRPKPSPRPDAPPRPSAPEQIRRWLSEATAAQQQGNLDEAMRLCRTVLTADPRNFPGLVLLGDLLARQGRHGDALVQYECAAAIQPTHKDVCDKIVRLQAILARKARAESTASVSAGVIASQIPAPPSKPAPKKSLMDRLMHRDK